MRPLVILLLFVLTGPAPARAQFADQKALEAALRELAPSEGTPVYVSPIMVAPDVNGRVRIDEENREILESRFGARIAEPGDVVHCADVQQPSTCEIADGGVIFQFFMPEPVSNGVLNLAVLVLTSGTGEGGQIGREWWNLALIQRPNVGWTVADRRLANTANGPW